MLFFSSVFDADHPLEIHLIHDAKEMYLKLRAQQLKQQLLPVKRQYFVDYCSEMWSSRTEKTVPKIVDYYYDADDGDN